MAHIDGFSQKIPVDFYHLTGKRRRDLGLLIHGFHPAAGSLKTIQVQAFMGDGPMALIPPPFFQSLKQHARMEDPAFKPIHPGPVVLQHKFHKLALDFGRWGHGCFGYSRLAAIVRQLRAYKAPSGTGVPPVRSQAKGLCHQVNGNGGQCHLTFYLHPPLALAES